MTTLAGHSPHVLFVDAACCKPHCDRVLPGEGIGGTEATVMRVARGLVERGWRATIAQPGRHDLVCGADGVCYAPFDHKLGLPAVRDADAVVVVRQPKLLPALRRQHPEARLLLWLHCFPGTRRWTLGRLALEAGAAVVAVSDCHREAVIERVARRDPASGRALDVRTVYNPIAPGLARGGDVVDRDKLVFLSSPHKGLDQVLAAFAAVRRAFPSMRLCVANPGYLRGGPADGDSDDGVEVLGSLAHEEAIEHVRSALCLFYPQARFAETFGLVFAEANAVGTPVLAHPLGAATEVVAGHPEQLIDATDHGAVVERIGRWRAGARPVVACDPRFELEAVLERWESLLRDAPSSRRARRAHTTAGGGERRRARVTSQGRQRTP